MDSSIPIDLGRIAQDLQIRRVQVENVALLLDEGNTVPFITRYRKERTGGLNEVAIREIQSRLKRLRELSERKATILKSIESQGKLTDELAAAIKSAENSKRLEDLYLPHKPKKRTKAAEAVEKGLEPLATAIAAADPAITELTEFAAGFVNAEKGVEDAAKALEGAGHILAERFHEMPGLRDQLRRFFWKTARLVCSKAESLKDGEGLEFRDYFTFTEAIGQIPPHRVLAINRGEKEKALVTKIAASRTDIDAIALEQAKIREHPHEAFLTSALADSLDRLLLPGLEREIRRDLSELAERHAVDVFARNLRGLLMQPPVPGRVLLAIDPGLRSGSKLAVLDASGTPLEHAIIYPHPPQLRRTEAKTVIKDLVGKHGIEVVVIGNGTACRETEELVAEIIAEATHFRDMAARGESPAPFPSPTVGDESTMGTGLEDSGPAPPANGLIENGAVAHSESDLTLAAGPEPIVASTPEMATNISENGDGSAVESEPEPVLAAVEPEPMLAADEPEPILAADEPAAAAAIVADAAGESSSAEAPPDASEIKPQGRPAPPLKRSAEPAPPTPHPADSILAELEYVIVNEAGASHYSTSPLAREEFPEGDAGLRGTISIGRRLLDPLAELVKIDPQNIGVGLYQHDLHHKQLKESLESVVESCVNHVGVNLNTASVPLLRHVSGLNQVTARRVAERRTTIGLFTDRSQIQEIEGVGPVAYTQAAGFLKIKDGANPLDATWVHPESYPVVERLLAKIGKSPEAVRDRLTLAEAVESLAGLDISAAAREFAVGEPTLRDIVDALARPDRDPRDELPKPIFRRGILKLEDLAAGMELKGTVLNVVDFGAFVDIGLKDSGLVHISQLANRYVRSPHDVVTVGDIVTVWVMGVDFERKRVSLTMVKPGTERQRGAPPGGEVGSSVGGGRRGGRRGAREAGDGDRRGAGAARGPSNRVSSGAAGEAKSVVESPEGAQAPGDPSSGGGVTERRGQARPDARGPGRGGPRPQPSEARGGGGPDNRQNRGAPGQSRGQGPPRRTGAAGAAPAHRPPPRPSKPKAPPPPLSKDALAGHVPLHSFGQLKQLWEARKEVTPPADAEPAASALVSEPASPIAEAPPEQGSSSAPVNDAVVSEGAESIAGDHPFVETSRDEAAS